MVDGEEEEEVVVVLLAKREAMDREEAAYQAAERKKYIQRANTLHYENTQRVKAFGSKLYLSDVMKDRELQLEIKRQIKDRNEAEEKMWHERIIEAVKLGDAEQERKREERQQRALHAKQVHLDQLKDFRVRYVDGKRSEKRAGELIKERVEMHIAEEKRQERERKEVRYPIRDCLTNVCAPAPGAELALVAGGSAQHATCATPTQTRTNRRRRRHTDPNPIDESLAQEEEAVVVTRENRGGSAQPATREIPTQTTA